MNLRSSSFFSPISFAILQRSLIVIESKYSLSLLPASFQTICVTHSPDFSQGLLESSGLTQSTGLIPPSVIRTISPTVISSGFLLKKYPPEGPLLLPMIPPLFNFWNICSIYLGEIPSRLEMSLTCVFNPSE